MLALRERTVVAYLGDSEAVVIVRVLHGGQDYESIIGHEDAG